MNLDSKIGYGYDTLSANYVDSECVRMQSPILTLNENDIRVTSNIKNNTIHVTGTSLYELSTKLNIVAGVKGGYKLFSGSVNVTYDNNSDLKESCVYSKFMSIFKKKRHTLIKDGDYKNYLTATFKKDVETLEPYDFFKKYGTHLIVDIIYGGRMEMDFVTTLSEKDNYEEITAELTAAYAEIVSAESKMNLSKKTKEVLSKSKFEIHSTGGKGISNISINNFSEEFKLWVDSLEDEEKNDICDIPDNSNANLSFVPLWELSESEERKEQLMTVYQKLYKLKYKTMSAMNSQLSSFDFTYDAMGHKVMLNNNMVAAISQYSINKAMKEYVKDNPIMSVAYTLYTIDDKNKSVYFNLSEDTDPASIPDAFPEHLRNNKNLYKELCSLNLFNISSDEKEWTDEESEAINKAYDDYYLSSAYMFESGIPQINKNGTLQYYDFTMVDLNPSYDPNNTGAIYTQGFKGFKIIEIKQNRRKIIFNKITQEEMESPWLYSYNIKFGFNNAEFESLPDYAKEQIKNHFKLKDSEVASLFSMAQLKLDLATLAFAKEPEISGLDEETMANLKVILERYIKKEMDKAFVIGHVVLPKDTNLDYFFVPKRYRFSVSDAVPYDGIKDPELKTLNYVISFADEDPVPMNYNWEWIRPDFKMAQSGVFVINRNVFFKTFCQDFNSDVLYTLKKKVEAIMIGNHKTIFDLRWSYNITNDNSKKSEYVFDSEKNAFELVTYKGDGGVEKGHSSHSHAGQISFYIPPVVGGTADFELRYDLNSTANWGVMKIDDEEIPAIVISTDVVLWVNLVYNSGNSKGNIYNHTLKCYIGFKIGERGEVSMVKKFENIDNGKTIKVNEWAEFTSMGGVPDVLNRISETMIKYAENYVNKFTDNFEYSYKHNMSFIMPGYKTFVFDNARFSKYGDFCVDILYK